MARLTLPRLPDQLVNLDVVIAVPSGGEPLGLDSTPEASAWRDPVIVVRTYMLSDFSKKPSRNPFTVDRCIPRNARSRTREPSRIEVELARDVHGVTRSRYLPDPSRNPAAVDRCLDARIAELRFPTLPPSLPRLTVVYRPANR
ncbi:MAG: hypothetical protein ABIY55_28625 [Kofleriaceae bacterium]